MTVQCSHCGEPLMGSVNRCWRCGRSLVAVAGEPDLPPIRRAPVDLQTIATATLADDAAAGAERNGTPLVPPSPVVPPSNESFSGVPPSASLTSTESRTTPPGSNPASSTASDATNKPTVPSPRQPNYPNKVFAESCAITSVVVGVLTAFAAILTAWSLIPALVGIGLGAVGLGSDRRKTAAIGIALCCLVVLISAGRVGVWAYQDYERRQMEMYGEF